MATTVIFVTDNYSAIIKAVVKCDDIVLYTNIKVHNGILK